MSSTRSTPVEMIANGDELFAEEEHALLLVRLRAVAFLLSAGLTLVLVREELFGGGPGWPLASAGPARAAERARSPDAVPEVTSSRG